MGLGTLLEKERLEQGLTIGEMSERTRIKPQFLQAIEHEDYHLLPGEAYVKPFIRTYAKALGLDDEIFLADQEVAATSLAEDVEPAHTVAVGKGIRERRERARRARRRRFIFRLVAAIVIIIGSVYFAIRLMNI